MKSFELPYFYINNSMKRSLTFLAIGLLSPLLHATDNEPPSGFTALWNGKDLSGFFGWGTRDPREMLAMKPEELATYKKESIEGRSKNSEESVKAHWRVENEELVNDGKGLYLTTDRDYGNIELFVDYKMQPFGDSGIYLRGVPQVQIWDYTEKEKFKLGADKGSGGLWNNDKGSPGKDPLVLADKPFGEWNHLRILMIGSRVSVWLNEKQVVDHAILENYFDKKLPKEQRRPILPRGPIQLQTHGSEIRWKNIYLREIGSDEACKILAGKGHEGYESIWNGKDFEGWIMDNGTRSPGDVMKVEDDHIVWLRDKDGTPYWNNELKDFQARVEFKLPPGGNNGLAIRYPGNGNTAYDGMTELQVLDDNYEKVKGKIDPRQVHGSAYGMVAAARGYQHPIGEWNFEEVTVKGSTIKVELNGTVILDCDLSKVDMATVMAKAKHPGKNRTSGYFGLAGHDDPVQFKDLLIKKL